MTIYKFDTVVSENGVIKMPGVRRLARRKVEIFVIPKPESIHANAVRDENPVDQFLTKWQGAFTGVDSDSLKSQYLQEKYG